MCFPNDHLCGFGVSFWGVCCCCYCWGFFLFVFFKMENISPSHILTSNCREYNTMLVAIMRHIQVSISIVTALCLGWWLKPVVPHQSPSFSQLLIVPVKKCVYVIMKTSAVGLVIVHSQIRSLQDIHDLMCRCQSVVCGPIYMCKHSVALYIRFIWYAQCTV